jgi:hypothetical protein
MFDRCRKAALLTTTGVTVIAAAAACGNPITANHDWKSLNALVTVTEHVGPNTVTGYVLAGRLTDAQGRLLLTTRVQETCAHVSGPASTSAAYKCIAIVNTGPKVYVAGGMAAGPFGTLTSLAGGNAPGTISFTKLSGGQPASVPLLVKISAVKG